MVGVAKHNANPAPKARRAAPEIHDDIEHLPSTYAHKLALGLLYLEMEAAQRMSGRMAVIVLREGHSDAGGRKFLLLPVL